MAAYLSIPRLGQGQGPRFSLGRPSAEDIRSFVGEQRRLDFTYAPVGGTEDRDAGARAAAYSSYNIDSNRTMLGRGAECFDRACRAIRNWQMFDLSWVELCWPDTHIAPGSAVAVVARVSRGYVTCCARVVYAVEETGDVERYGFAYGTLPGHILAGEERFLVTHDRARGWVHYEVTAASKPTKAISWLGYPVIRRLQTRFRAESTEAMVRAVAS